MFINMGTKKVILYVLIIVIIIAAISVLYVVWRPFSVNKEPEGATVVQVFRASGARFAQLNVNGWEECEIKPLQEDAEQYLSKRLQRLFSQEENLPEIKTVHHSGGFITQGLGKTGQGITVLATINAAGQHEKQPGEHAYFTVALSTANPHCSYDILYTILDSIMEGDSYHRSTVIRGEISGKVSNDQRRKVIRDMIKEAQAQTINVIENDSMVSVSAHTSQLPEPLTTGRQSVNINMAARYNSVEKKTIWYVGSPIITSEY